jgi:hypothetical protein
MGASKLYCCGIAMVSTSPKFSLFPIISSS